MKKLILTLLLIITIFCLNGCEDNKPVVLPTSSDYSKVMAYTNDEENSVYSTSTWGDITIKYNYIKNVETNTILHPGDTVEISGNAVPEGDLVVYMDSDDDPEERYILGKAEKNQNSWSCSFRLSRWGIKANDNQYIELPERLFGITISDGKTEVEAIAKVDTKKGYYKDFASDDLQPASQGAIFISGGSLYSFNPDINKIQKVYSNPAFVRSSGLSPDKTRLAFTSYAGEEAVICIYYMNQGEITYIPAQYDLNNGVIWVNDDIIMTEGHHNPSANAFACYNTDTGDLVSSAIGLDALPATDGSYILFSLSPHFIESPLPDNIESTQLIDAGKILYTVKNPDDKIVVKKLSDDGNKLFFIESLNNGELQLSWADLTKNGLVNISSRSIPMGINSYYSALVSDNLQEVYVVYSHDQSDKITLYHTKASDDLGHTDEYPLSGGGKMNKSIELLEKNHMRYLVRTLDTGEVNIKSGWPIVIIQIYELNNKLELVSESEKIDYSDYAVYLNNQFNPADPEKTEQLRKAAKEFFNYSFDCSLEDMGIKEIEWFGSAR